MQFIGGKYIWVCLLPVMFASSGVLGTSAQDNRLGRVVHLKLFLRVVVLFPGNFVLCQDCLA